MTVEETKAAYGPRYSSFRLPMLTGAVFELRPFSVVPERMVAIMYRRGADDWLHRGGVGKVKKGQWVNTAGKPLEADYYWAIMADEAK